jgi:hypothetical protein
LFILSDSALDVGNNLYTASKSGYWNGDRVTVDCLPTATGPFPPRVAGYASYYGSNWFLGPNRSHIGSNADSFYKTAAEAYPDGDLGDSSQFYSREGDTSVGNVIPPCTSNEYYMHVDSLDRVSFYLERCDALAGCLPNRINLFSVAGDVTVSPYEAAWQQLCDLAQWSLELNAPSVETTSVSEKFGNAVKSLVTGGGSAEFLIDRKCYTNEKDSGLALFQLLMMTEKGCEATAQFWMVDRGGSCGDINGSIQGGLYYEANILVTASAVNLRPAEIVAGTVQFVTTEDIKLLVTS